MMRIITGKDKSRLIKMPAGIRPTSNKVRKALFDILGEVKGLSFLELFAGSGAVGLEALSNGAKRVVFVEKDRRCSAILRSNLSSFPDSVYRIFAQDAFRAIEKLQLKKDRFDIIFLDPPYYQELGKKTLKMLGSCDILAPIGLAVAQHYKKDSLPDKAGSLYLLRQSGYGDTVLSFYRKSEI